jgi:chloride channel protein, CIC family
VLGVVFVRGIVASLDLYKRLRLSLPGQIAIAGLVTGIILALSPEILRDNASLQEVWRTSEFPWPSILLIFTMKFGLTLVAVGSGAPGGLFAPSLILGSALGYLVCYATAAIVHLLGFSMTMDAGFSVTFALAGMAAFFSAVTRGPITAIVIVFEMTQEFSIVLPLMIASVTAYLVGESIMTGSVYKYLLARNGIVLKPGMPMENRLSGLKAADIMQRPVETLPATLTIAEAKQVFLRSPYRGFPVVDDSGIVGVLTRSDFTKLETLEDLLEETSDIQPIMTRKPITVRPHDPLPQVLYWLNHYKIGHLPVIDQTQVVGIITRADIIRVESEQLSGRSGARDVIAKHDPSYLVYQTRDPAIGRGKILLPIHHSETAAALMNLAAGIAADRGYELECLMIVVVSRLRPPAQTSVSTAECRKVLRAARRLGDRYGISVHTQIRVSHDASSAILEVIRDRHIDLLLTSWEGVTEAPDRIFGPVVDTLIKQATCDVMLVKWGIPSKLDRWLIPTAGGPNSERAMTWLPGLMKQSATPEAFLCYVSDPDCTPEVSTTALDRARRSLQSRVHCETHAIAVCSHSIPDAVIDLASVNTCDVILMGATQTGLLQQVIQGNIPEAIARRSIQTVIVVRGALPEG